MSSHCPVERTTGAAQHGVALVTVLLVVAIATIAVVEIATRQQFDMRRAEVRNGLEQARLIAVGAESVAAWTLAQDRRRNTVDALNEDWTQPVATELAGADVQGQLLDLQGRFNLNTVYDGENENALAVGRLQRLLRGLEIDPGLSSAIIDWIDPDTEVTGSDGAEDAYYASLERPYRAANRPFISPTELRLVRGVTTEIYAKLLPLVSTLPGDTSINVNTAPVELILALDERLDQGAVEQWAEQRTGEDARVFAKVSDFLGFFSLNAQDFDASGLAVSSQYFELQALVQIGRVQYALYSRLWRNDNGASQVQLRYRGMI